MSNVKVLNGVEVFEDGVEKLEYDFPSDGEVDEVWEHKGCAAEYSSSWEHLVINQEVSEVGEHV